MAVARPAASAQRGSAFTGVHIALIAFVCVTLASLVGLVLMFTRQSDLQQRAETATNRASSARAELSSLKKEFAEGAKLITGNPDHNAEAIVSEVDTLFGRIVDEKVVPDPQAFARPAVLVTAFSDLYDLYVERVNTSRDLEQQVAQLTEANQALAEEFEQRKEEFLAQASQLEQSFQELEKAAKQNRQQSQQQLSEVEGRLDRVRDQAAEELNSERAEREKLETQVAETNKRMAQLLEIVEQFRPSLDESAVLQVADARVLSAIPGQPIVYIDIGRAHHVTPGLNFAIYSAVTGIPKDGKGKATIEVVTPFQDQSECRVVEMAPNQVIVAGDLVANPVYDRDKTYNFAVVGDFDLDYDGKVEDVGGEQVKAWVKSWGGRVVERVDESTDFVVLGESPGRAVTPGPDADDATRLRAEQRREAAAAFKAALDEARALSIPILTRTRFLHFVGLSTPADAE